MACNRTIINSVDEDSYYHRMFIEKDIGISVSNSNPKGVAYDILELYNNKEKHECLPKNG